PILLLAALLAPVPQSAEEAFNRIEAAIAKSRTLRVSFTLETDDRETLPGKGQLTVEEGGKSSLTATLRSAKQKITLSEEFDGRKVVSKFESRVAEAQVD